jgi:hypothetical protein
MEKEYRVHIALAHDAEWMKAGTNQVLMGLLDDELREAAKTKIRLGESLA